MNRKLITAALTTILCTSAQASTVFVPTDTTVNFIKFFGSNATLIGLFDDTDTSYSGNYLAVNPSNDEVLFTGSGADYILTGNSATAPFTLIGSNRFSLAAWSPLLHAWLAPDAVTCANSSSSCFLSWSGMLVELVVDVAIAPDIAEIPIPASALLLGSGAVGLVAVGRRRIPEHRGETTLPA